jgi:predicted MFS family arabinose efflux permease
MMLLSCALLAGAAVELVFARGFWPLFGGQLLLVISRASFWPANWSIATELPGARGVQVGRLNAVTNLGQILGNASCGFALAAAGFSFSFLLMGAFAVAAWALGLRLPSHGARHAGGKGLFANYGRLLRVPLLYYAMMCAYLSALPFSLSTSFYPLLLQQFGYGEESSGILVALRAVGGIAAGLLVARFVRTGAASAWPVWSGVAVAFSVGLISLFPHWAALGALLLAVGLASGVMTVYFQMTLSEAAGPEMRGSAMALGGFGWGLSHFSTPLAMGFIADHYGLVAGFHALGGAALAVALSIAVLRRWAFASARLAA